MPTRSPTVAGLFYPADRAACQKQLRECLQDTGMSKVSDLIRAGVVPHAGWTYSGPAAAKVYAAIGAQGTPETVVLFGAVHSWGVGESSVYASGSWRTPLGKVEIDEALATAVLDVSDGLIVDRPQAHDGEHSIEVQLPFLRHLFPSTLILPIAVPPSVDSHTIGKLVARVARSMGRQAPAIASSDLTHYGPRYGMAPGGTGQLGIDWAKANDRRLLDLVVQMRADEVVTEATAHHNACGAGAIAAAMAYASELGASRGLVLQHTNSYEAMPLGAPSDHVGYAAVALV